jgi:hypothetical protein
MHKNTLHKGVNDDDDDNNNGNKKIFLQKLLYGKETHSPVKAFYPLSLQIFGLIFTFG